MGIACYEVPAEGENSHTIGADGLESFDQLKYIAKLPMKLLDEWV